MKDRKTFGVRGKNKDRRKTGKYTDEYIEELYEETPDEEAFDEEPFDTVNGFVISRLEHIPEEGEDFEFEYEGYLFRILEVKDRMIQSVLAHPLNRETV